MDLRVLLRCWKRFHNDEALEVVNLTLDKMARGGIYDHLGGGFARYSVDDKWLVPHFEKMLYDNAQLLELLALAWSQTGRDLFRQRAQETRSRRCRRGVPDAIRPARCVHASRPAPCAPCCPCPVP